MERLKQLRTAAGMTQQDVARLLGVDRTTYVKYENGNSDPSTATLVRLADYFGVSVDYLIGQKEKAPTQEGERKKINTITIAGRDGSYIVKQLTDEQLQAFKTMFEHLPQVEDDL